MFLKYFSRRQSQLFLSMAKEILSVDGVINEAEEKYLESACNEMNIAVHNEIPLEKNRLSTEYPSQELKNIVIIELYSLAYSDFNFDVNEKLYISDIAKFLELEESLLLEIEHTMKTYIESRMKLVRYANKK